MRLYKIHVVGTGRTNQLDKRMENVIEIDRDQIIADYEIGKV